VQLGLGLAHRETIERSLLPFSAGYETSPDGLGYGRDGKGVDELRERVGIELRNSLGLTYCNRA
jgi:hypothetical protein